MYGRSRLNVEVEPRLRLQAAFHTSPFLSHVNLRYSGNPIYHEGASLPLHLIRNKA